MMEGIGSFAEWGFRLFAPGTRGEYDFVEYGIYIRRSTGAFEECFYFFLRDVVGNAITDQIGI